MAIKIADARLPRLATDIFPRDKQRARVALPAARMCDLAEENSLDNVTRGFIHFAPSVDDGGQEQPSP
jgi:hypothetical protein